MISISKKFNTLSFLALLVLLFALVLPLSARAQSALSFSVSPTIFDMTGVPGQTWQSTVRIINANPYELRIYVDMASFVPKGESGAPRFIPLSEIPADQQALAKWITTEKEVIIPPEKTIELPFTITLPQDAAPGGHFAAFMISTKPPEVEGEVPNVQTSQVITSLVFLRVSGDVRESSSVRSFRTSSYILSKPEATFELRIENKGNVHVQPQGEIEIYNMWGQKRGTIPVNQQTLFGNVLPNSVRKYSFTWNGEWSPTDIGRYTAVATLGYGLDEKQFMHADTAFWIIPWKFLLLIFGVVGGFIALMTWGIKLYVRRMLALAGVAPGTAPVATQQAKTAPSPVSIPLTKSRTRKQQIATVVAPIEVSILDLRSKLKETGDLKKRFLTLVDFVKTYWKFFVAVIGIILFVFASIWFFRGASTPERDFEVTIEGEGKNVTVTSDDMSAPQEAPQPQSLASDQAFTLTLVNRSGDQSLIENTKNALGKNGYQVVSARDEVGAPEERTVIVYDPRVAETALKLSKVLDNALLSSYASETATSSEITIYLGTETIEKVSR
ncbi:MAG: hypothetical protein RL538_825 [Candidatus Parcubacteria bacterium]|jgi:phage pi2 protein 07